MWYDGYIFMTEYQSTVRRPRTPEYYHFLYVAENDGREQWSDWGRTPAESNAIKF
eukprot:gene23349-23760_t